MDKTDNLRQLTLFNELHKCLDALRGSVPVNMNSLLMPLLYVLCAHHEGHLVSIISDGTNVFSGEKHIQPLLNEDLNDAESDLLKRIRLSVDERLFQGKTLQIIDEFYSRNSDLIKEYYPELIEYIFSFYSKNSGKYSGLFVTPAEVTKLMYYLAYPQKPSTIYDPCAGLCSGVILSEAESFDFIGQEIDEQIKILADVRLDAHGKVVSLYHESCLDKWRGDEADCLCSDFPIGVRVQATINGTQRRAMLEDVIMWNFLNTASLKHAVVLTSMRFCWDRLNFDLRKTLCEKNYIDTVIELPKGVLSYSGVQTAIVVLNKERSSKDIRFVSASDCFIQGLKDKTLDLSMLMARLDLKEDEQMCVCSVNETYKHDCSLAPSDYIDTEVELQAGQKLVKFISLATEIRHTHYDDKEGDVLTEDLMSDSIASFHTVEHHFEKHDVTQRSYNKLAQPCIIFNLRANKFFIKSDEKPLFVSPNYRAFSVNTAKCLPEYLVLAILNSPQVKSLAEQGAGAPRIDYRRLSLPIYVDLNSQKQIVEREYRREAQQYRKKLERLQTLSGQSSDLLHNLGVTFTKLSAAIATLQKKNSSETVCSLDDNVNFALRQINSTGTDFSKAVPSMQKMVLQELIEKYMAAWKNFGYASFSLLPLKSSIPQTKVEVDPDLLFTALDCIFINAHQHGFNKRADENNQVSVELRAVTIDEQKYALISIANNGDPMPDGFTLQEFAARGVVGLNSSQDGLGGHHVASIAHLHEGKISIESSSEWLSFNILIPTYTNAKDTVFDEYECECL